MLVGYSLSQDVLRKCICIELKVNRITVQHTLKKLIISINNHLCWMVSTHLPETMELCGDSDLAGNGKRTFVHNRKGQRLITYTRITNNSNVLPFKTTYIELSANIKSAIFLLFFFHSGCEESLFFICHRFRLVFVFRLNSFVFVIVKQGNEFSLLFFR